jgi:acetyl-CoA C-acetyltransferase
MKKNDDAVVVLGYARTPVGSFGKSLAKVPAHMLGATAAKAALERSGVTAADVDEWIIGCVGSTGTDAYISRRVALEAGAPVESTAMTINRLCGSAMQAIGLAAQELMVGESDIVVAGGTENMSAQPFMDFSGRHGVTLGNRTVLDGTNSMITDPFTMEPMGITAENVATRSSRSPVRSRTRSPWSPSAAPRKPSPTARWPTRSRPSSSRRDAARKSSTPTSIRAPG